DVQRVHNKANRQSGPGMQSFIKAIEPVTAIIWQGTWQAACLAVLVGVLLAVLRSQIAARWRFVLWSLVFVRLALPIVAVSRTSIFRIAQPPVMRTVGSSAGSGDIKSFTPIVEHVKHAYQTRAELIATKLPQRPRVDPGPQSH